MSKLIALVGRPNVGKSTLFNRLSIKGKAIVHDLAGVTRDRKYGIGRIGPMEFRLVDTPGLEEAKDGCLEHRMMQQTKAAMEEADIVCLVIDNLDGVTTTDKFFANMIRKQSQKTILIVNKCESKFNHDGDYYKLGFDEIVPLSAEHGVGMVDLYESIEKVVGKAEEIPDPIKEDGLQIVVVGRPNAGKSTFVNSLLGQERMLTGPEAGITRESVEIAIKHKDQSIKLIDTAGLRRRSNVTKSLEKMSTGDTIESIRYANTVILMIDAIIALESQDLTIASYVVENGRSLVIAVNKWDLIEHKQDYIDELNYKLEKNLPQVRNVPVVYLSAANDENIAEVLDACLYIYKLWNQKISTRKLNDWLQFALDNHQLPLSKKLGRRVRIKYISQINSRPPTFKLFSNLPAEISDTYKKYLINSIRESFNLPGVPIRLRFVKTENPYEGRKKKRKR